MRSFEVDVERLVHGPGSLARGPDGRVVFLDGGLPGERVVAEVVEERRDFLRARVAEVLAGSEQSGRRRPPCPVVSECGGCPWQHLDHVRQVASKQDVVLREIWRATRTSPREVLPPVVGDEWRTRHRIRLAVGRSDGSVHIGYRARGSHRIVSAADCRIAHPSLIAALPLAHALADAVTALREVELTIDDREALRILGFVDASAPLDAGPLLTLLESAATLEGARLAGIALEQAREPRRAVRWRAEAGDVTQRIDIAPGLELGVPLGAFTQVNLALNRELVRLVVEASGAAPEREIVDLFCGAGNFALPIARAGARVTGIDADARAIAAASESASRLGLAERCRFVPESASGPEAVAVLPERFDACVIDPPRAGAADVLPMVLARRPERIVYVSCDAATFARDVRAILAGGYQFSSLRLVDLTPQTFRAELLGVFQLTW